MRAHPQSRLIGDWGRKTTRLVWLLPGQQHEPVQCEMQHVSLNSRAEYEALSYCWGDVAETLPIEVDGSSVAVTTNLHSALTHLRLETSPRALWVDFICVNQQDLEERNQQVQIMRDIYEKAGTVLIWLGPSDAESESAILLIKGLSIAAHWDDVTGSSAPNLYGAERHWLLPSAGSERWYAVFKLWRRPWFYRAWVVQEVAVAAKAIFICGKDVVQWDHMVQAVEYAVTCGIDVGFDPDAMAQVLSIDKTRKNFTDGKDQPTLQLLIRHRRTLATDARDKVYAFWGLFPRTEFRTSFAPDYRKRAEVIYTNLAIGIIMTSFNLDLFSVPQVFEGSRLDGLPSWVPDWSTSDPCQDLLQLSSDNATPCYHKPFQASKDSVCVPEFDMRTARLKLEGVIVDQVYFVSEVMKTIHQVKPSNDITGELAAMIEVARIMKSWDMVAIYTARYYPTGEWMTDAYWQTILGGRLIVPWNTAFYLFYKWYLWQVAFRFLQYLGLDRAWFLWPAFVARAGIMLVAVKLHLTWIGKIFQIEPRLSFGRLSSAAHSRCIIRTRGGYIGLAPQHVTAGDQVAICKGGKLPLIVRRRGENYELIGDCYIHGMMNGEAFEEDECQSMWFV